jgi:glycosyltransferase involved in cell wall biosynthesis
VWDAVDALGPLFEGRANLVDNPLKRLVFRCEAMRTRREEAILATRFQAAIAVTEREAALIGPGVLAIPNGVDCDYFKPSGETLNPRKPLRICMFGRWNYLPNAHGCARFLRDVWPSVCRAFPDAICTVIGPGCEAGSTVADAAAAGVAAGTVVLEGPVPDIRPYIHSSVLTVCPAMLAAGMQNKILESIACGVPVVCTAIAAEGTLPGGMPGVFPASTTSEMIETITMLLADPRKANNVGGDGRAVVDQTMTWQPSYAKIAAVLEQVLQS